VFLVAPDRSGGQNVDMDALPFTLTAEAEAQIADCLAVAERSPRNENLLPSLRLSFNFQTWDSEDRITERFDGESWDECGESPDDVRKHGFLPLQLCGRTVWFPPYELEALTGKRLVVETIGVGVPQPADKKVRLLRAV